MPELDPQVCYRALRTRDERFDGRLFVGVTSTGIYCRPVCSARPAKFEHCRFYPSSAAAQKAGFRPCLRCRPETAPELGSWRGTSNTVSRGLSLIAQGELDGDQASVDALAERLGVGGRQLRRLFKRVLGASPVTLAQTRRVHLARQLLCDTRLPLGEIALASGFGSVRSFNETFRRLFHRPPSALRRKRIVPLPEGTVATTGITVRLRYQTPYDWSAILTYLRNGALSEIERVDQTSYRRTVLRNGLCGTIEIRHLPEVQSLAATIRFPCVRALSAIVLQIRGLFDLGTDAGAIGAHLAHDPLLAPLVAVHPGLRVPGAWDGFEIAVRTLLGRQVSAEAGRQITVELARLCGTALSAAETGDAALTLAFPSAAQVAAADLSRLGMPKTRRNALLALANATIANPRLFQPLATVEQTVQRLRAVRGIGDWTAQMIALSAVREPDAFPASDFVLLQCVAGPSGIKTSSAELTLRAERWRPFRAYAAAHLWFAHAASSRRPTRTPYD